MRGGVGLLGTARSLGFQFSQEQMASPLKNYLRGHSLWSWRVSGETSGVSHCSALRSQVVNTEESSRRWGRGSAVEHVCGMPRPQVPCSKTGSVE